MYHFIPIRSFRTSSILRLACFIVAFIVASISYNDLFGQNAWSYIGIPYGTAADFLMDDLRIYSEELTTSQIDAIYDAGRPS